MKVSGRLSPGVRPAAFSVNWSAFAIFMVVIGGLGRIEGPLIGALVFWMLNKFFSDYGTWYLLGLGMLAIVSGGVVLSWPLGQMGSAHWMGPAAIALAPISGKRRASRAPSRPATC